MKKNAIALMLIILITALCACNRLDNNNQSSNEQQNINISSFPETTTYKLNVKESKKDYELIKSYYDNENYYYCIKLGEIENVIVDVFTQPLLHSTFGGASYTRTYTISEVTSTSIENQAKWTRERLEFDDNLAGVSAGLKVGVLDKFELELSSSVQLYQNQTTTITSTGQIIKEEKTVTEQQTLSLVFDANCKSGYYRVCNVIDYDIFAVFSKNIRSGEISYEMLTLPKEGVTEVYEVYEYSETKFEEPVFEKLIIDTTYIDSLEIPNDYIDNSSTESLIYSIETIETSCKQDNGYNNATPDNKKVDRAVFLLDGIYFGNFIIRGAKRNDDNTFSCSPNVTANIAIRLKYDWDRLPLGTSVSNLSYSSAISNDSYAASDLKNMPHRDFSSGLAVNHGIIVATITYKDGNKEKIVVKNAFKSKYADDEIAITSNIGKPCEIKIAICFETVVFAPAAYHYNYRIDQTFEIK